MRNEKYLALKFVKWRGVIRWFLIWGAIYELEYKEMVGSTPHTDKVATNI